MSLLIDLLLGGAIRQLVEARFVCRLRIGARQMIGGFRFLLRVQAFTEQRGVLTAEPRRFLDGLLAE